MADKDPTLPPDPQPPRDALPTDPRSPAEMPRLPSAGRLPSAPGSGRTGYPATGLVRASSSGSITGAGGAMGSGRSAGTPPGGPPRNPSRERLEPLQMSPIPRSPSDPVLSDTTPRRNQPQLAPLTLPGAGGGTRGGSRPSTDRERPAGVPPLDLSTAESEQAKAIAGELVPPPPQPPEGQDDRLARRLQASEAPTARGPVRWEPHTHLNPKHAKFCFICLHGRLEGQKDASDVAERVALRTEDEDLPPPTVMKDCGYLLPTNDRFRRAGADFEKNNMTAEWLKQITHRVYGESAKPMLCKQNEDIIHGRDVKLVDFHEDLKDRELLERLFTLPNEEVDSINEKFSRLAKWCRDEEDRLLDVMPEPRPLGELPEVAGPVAEQTPGLEYRPLVDLAQLKGDSAAPAREAMRDADSLIASSGKRGFDGFHVETLPAPATYADMPEIDIVPYKIRREDLPAYERQQPMKPTRRPIEAIADPFSRPFLFLPEFEETQMPMFEGTAVVGKPKSTPPVMVSEDWLTPTRSIFEDNNDEPEKWGWGLVPARGRIMPPLVDDPYMPPDDLADHGETKRKFVVRNLWDPEFHTQEGRMVPPLKELARALYKPPPFTHPEDPIWTTALAPKVDATCKVKEIIGCMPVFSFARFKPKRISVTMPDFLWDLVKKDASGQNMWDVVKQRHDIPKELRSMEIERERAAQEEEERLMQMERDQAEGGEEPQHPDSAEAVLEANLAQSRTAFQELVAGTDSMQRTVREVKEGMPDVEVDVPGPPQPFETLDERPRQETAPDGEPLFLSTSQSATATMDHKQRVLELPERMGQLGGAGRKIEEIISDDRFIDTLADKIALRMGGAGAGLASPGNTMRGTLSGTDYRGSWATGVLSGKETLDGQPTTRIVNPEPPSFTDPIDERSKAELPRALQGTFVDSAKPHEQEATKSDSNMFTQEKMRGECYVRLLLQPEPHAARKVIQPYAPDTSPPDADLISKRSRPHVRMPPKPPVVGEDGETIEEDEFVDFEQKNDIIFSFVRHNRYDAVEALIQQDQEVVHATDDKQNSLLHTSCQNNNRRLTKLLLKNHIDINAQNARGNTALHFCYQYGFSDLAEYLLSHGADDAILNNDGFVPAQGTGRQEHVSGAQHGLRGTG